VTGSGKVEDVSPPSTIVKWSVRRNDIAISVAQMETSDPLTSDTDSHLATLDGRDDVTDTSQCTTEVEPCQRMEMTEPQGTSPRVMTVILAYLLLNLGARIQYGTW
jgi:hypothetical protein